MAKADAPATDDAVADEEVAKTTQLEDSVPSSTTAATSSSAQPDAAAELLVNINTANALELELLQNIGPAKAARIIEYREQNGPFTSVDDLVQVSGIGPKTLEDNASFNNY